MQEKTYTYKGLIIVNNQCKVFIFSSKGITAAKRAIKFKIEFATELIIKNSFTFPS